MRRHQCQPGDGRRLTAMDYIDSVKLSPAAIQRGADEERFAQLFSDWRADKIDDERWAAMRADNKDFDRWLWRQGVP